MTKLLELPLLNSVKRSNQVIIDSAKLLINRTGCNTLCFLGMTFKPDTDDLRNSLS